MSAYLVVANFPVNTSAYLVVANFPDRGRSEQICYALVSESIPELKTRWNEFSEDYYFVDYLGEDEMPVPLRIIHVDANGKTEILPWEDS